MIVLLDTNILIDFFHDNPRAVALMKSLEGKQLRVSALTIMEIIHGAHKTKTPERYISEFKNFLADFSVDVWPIDEVVATRCGELLAVMEGHGIRLGVVDALLAATALYHKCSIVSGDRAFRKVPGLDVYPSA
ncbi:hypothetical protein A2875_01065 [Candidatus Gottesmanbacteria bacterium RIFCSPHIGHO2_01_FULL_46_14]|uniref:Ribonuclease VapC n=2 Tax=Candidatus Gottesmaniibacteriota TaxID=1752720 RepID=A0A1F5ZMI2_9BACT|nr:MAG: hypothetical protein A2875_01065 [Candidatus Gottesmanbacteria bacterium RIFCSPHIGHO2_01_FULL_46_14]OGG28958.1 MAG: hypothetical protein A2971_04905 [Candidatus Gottesmanbacteria bacterium RIFCSPLOWO2_01_FULL_46_21]